MAFLWAFTSFGTLFMAKIHQLPITTVGLVMSGFGFGAFLGAPIVGTVSDHRGRRWTLFLCQLVGGLAALILVTFSPGTAIGLLFPFIFVAAFASCGVTPVLLAVSTETVGFAMAATAIGAVTGVGELIGGGILPTIRNEPKREEQKKKKMVQGQFPEHHFGIHGIFGASQADQGYCFARILFNFIFFSHGRAYFNTAPMKNEPLTRRR